MDDQSFKLAAWSLAAAVFAMLLDAVLGKFFDVPAGFWAVPSGVLVFLGTRSEIRRRRNGNGNGAK